ncbi:MAG: MotA/TolQ/ExbB proton channel family protein [Verrucomicrobia bacterium]|nr:MotA/TolQ/ExbB proton channel family protein [Verrucomicrobiota bacterium]
MFFKVLSMGGWMMWLLLLLSAVAVATLIERVLLYHREQINSAEFLSGVRNVLKRDNVVEALSICDATPGPVARMVKAAVLSRDKGREGIREALEEAGAAEIPRLEEKLNILATIAQIAPILGLLGTVVGFMSVFEVLEQGGRYVRIELLSGGIWKAMICTAFGLAVSVPAYLGYNFLVSRVNSIVLDMERASTDILNMLSEKNSGPKA